MQADIETHRAAMSRRPHLRASRGTGAMSAERKAEEPTSFFSVAASGISAMSVGMGVVLSYMIQQTVSDTVVGAGSPRPQTASLQAYRGGRGNPAPTTVSDRISRLVNHGETFFRQVGSMRSSACSAARRTFSESFQ